MSGRFQEWTYTSTTTFPLTTQVHEIEGGEQEHLEQTKSPCFQSQMKRIWFTAVLPSSLHVKSQNRTKVSKVTTLMFRNSDHLMPMSSEATNYLLSGFHFSTHTHCTDHQRDKFPQVFYPTVCVLTLVLQIKKKIWEVQLGRHMNPLIIEAWMFCFKFATSVIHSYLHFSGLAITA